MRLTLFTSSVMEPSRVAPPVPPSTTLPVCHRHPSGDYTGGASLITLGFYDPNSDHRRKGVYKTGIDTLRTKSTTLQTLVQAIVNYDDDTEAFELIRQMRSSESLEVVAYSVTAQEKLLKSANQTTEGVSGDEPVPENQLKSEFACKMSELMIDDSRKLIGGTSTLIFLPPGSEVNKFNSGMNYPDLVHGPDFSPANWTTVTDNIHLINHLMTMYFTWHYPFFMVLSKDMFYRDYVGGMSGQFCSSLLVNVMLALGCHFSSLGGSREDPENSATTGDRFFKEAERLVFENDEHMKARLCTVQALALLSVREAGCGREGKGWVYSGMSFRMAFDLGLNVDASSLDTRSLSDEEKDARRITLWGCHLIDKSVVTPDFSQEVVNVNR